MDLLAPPTSALALFFSLFKHDQTPKILNVHCYKIAEVGTL